MKRLHLYILSILFSGFMGLFSFSGCSTDSGSEAADTAPPMPGNSGIITISNVTETRITLSWEPATDNVTLPAALEYCVYMSDEANIYTFLNAQTNGILLQNWTSNIITFNAAELTHGTTYYFNVFVQDEVNNISDFAGETGTTMKSDDNNAPSPGNEGVISVSEETESTLTLAWTKATDDVTPQDELEYRVFQSASENIDTVINTENNGTPLQEWTTDLDSTLAVTSLLPFITYYFNIIVKDSVGNKAVYSMTPGATSEDVSDPVPGTDVLATVDGSTVYITWGEGADNAGSEGLDYKLVRDISPITDVDFADSFLPPVMSYASYSSISMPVSDPGLSEGTYYYNVIVRDMAGNMALYSGASASVEEFGTYIVSGSIILPDSETLSNGYYDIWIGSPIYGYSSTYGDWESGNSQIYSLDNVYPGDYYVIVAVYDDSDTLLYSYYSSTTELSVIDSDVTGYNVSVEGFVTYTVSGSIILPDSETLSNGYYGIWISSSIYGGSFTYGDWESGNSQIYSLDNVYPGDYYVIVAVYDDSYTFLYSYYSSTTELSVIDSDVTGYNVNVEEFGTYIVSGSIILPDSETLSNGYYDIWISSSTYGYSSTYGDWESGNSQIYSLDNVYPDDYYVNVDIYDDSDTLLYSYYSSTTELSVIDSDVTGWDIYVEVE